MKAIVCAGLVLLSLPVWAQDLPNAPSHSFWDKQQQTITAVNLAANTLDAVTTQRFLSQHTGTEGDPLAKPFVTHGWPGQIALSYGINTAGVVWLQYLAHRAGHHRIERWIGMAQIAEIGSAGVGNVALWNPPAHAAAIPASTSPVQKQSKQTSSPTVAGKDRAP